MKKIQLVNILKIINFILLISIIELLIIGKMTFKLNLKGQEHETVEVFTKYDEKGVVAKMYGKSIDDIKVKGTVKSNKIGTYTKTYLAQGLVFKKELKRKIDVVDTKAPEIILKGNDNITLNIGENYIEEGYEVKDNYDKNLDNKVKITSSFVNDKVGTYEILYEVSDSSGNKTSTIRKINVVENNKPGTYIKGILIVNKKYHLPNDYNPGVDQTANQALLNLQNDAKNNGYNIPLISGFRSYETQNTIYNNNVRKDGEAIANIYSAKPGQSEHQTGLAFDVGKISDNYGETEPGKWLASNAHNYGFIIRYLKGKENITGYKYEPWHIRYVGVQVATEIYNKGITLEEYLGVA